jgi:exoribonuclease R
MDEKLPGKILIAEDAPEHKDKIVEVEITRYPSASTWPAGKIVNVLGFLNDPILKPSPSFESLVSLRHSQRTSKRKLNNFQLHWRSGILQDATTSAAGMPSPSIQ